MSALGKADMATALRNVRLRPKADIGTLLDFGPTRYPFSVLSSLDQSSEDQYEI